MRVIDRALEVLDSAEAPGTIVHFQEKWPEPLEKALHDCHPDLPPPIMDQMGRHIGSFLRGVAFAIARGDFTQGAKSPEATQHFRPRSAPGNTLDALHQRVSRVDVDARVLVTE